MLSVGRRALWLLALALLSLLQIAWFISSVPVALRIGAAGLLLVAAVRPDSVSSFTYNPPGSWTVEAGQTLIVLGAAEDVSRAREAAQPK